MGDKKKAKWFDEGAAEFRSFVDRFGEGDLPDGDWYLCPACARQMFHRDAVKVGELTIEHVPAEAFGGREMLLTCKECNNLAGHTLDNHIARRQEMIDFVNRKTSRPRKVVMQAGDGLLRAEMRWDQDRMLIQGVDAWNHKPVRDAYIRSMNSFADSGVVDPDHRMRINFARPDGYRAGLSMARAAYLTAFCVFGWPYVFGGGMAEFREHLMNPDSRTVPLTITYDAAADQSRRQFLLIDEPETLACVTVTMGQFTVCLPSPGRWRTFAQIAAAFESLKAHGSIYHASGKEVQWPIRAQYGRF